MLKKVCYYVTYEGALYNVYLIVRSGLYLHFSFKHVFISEERPPSFASELPF